jgi:NTP pyrophosphatase (non-canonical NTP hydrolase)
LSVDNWIIGAYFDERSRDPAPSKPAAVLYMEHTPRITVSGSFRKHLRAIEDAVEYFTKDDLEVLSPKSTEFRSESNGFVRLSGDRGDPRTIELKHVRSLLRSDCLYVVNPDGYIGTSAALEIGVAIAASLPVFTQETPDDMTLRELTRVVPIANVRQSLISNGHQLPLAATLSQLQRYFYFVGHARGFAEETPQELIMLLVEEVGEAAREIRKAAGISRRASKQIGNVAFELADCLIYVLSLANALKVDLPLALEQKERINERRKWVKNDAKSNGSKSLEDSGLLSKL